MPRRVQPARRIGHLIGYVQVYTEAEAHRGGEFHPAAIAVTCFGITLPHSCTVDARVSGIYVNEDLTQRVFDHAYRS